MMLGSIVSKIKDKLAAPLRFTRRNRLYLISFVILVLSAILVGLDNPTGIVMGWLAVIILLVAIARRWRKPWYFLILLFGSFLGAIFLSFLDRVVALSIAKWIGGVNADKSAAWHVFDMVISNIILLCAPMGILFGFMGFLITGVFRLFGLIRHSRAADGT